GAVGFTAAPVGVGCAGAGGEPPRTGGPPGRAAVAGGATAHGATRRPGRGLATAWTARRGRAPGRPPANRLRSGGLPRRCSRAPEHAARAFLAGYLPWLYGQGPLRAIHDTTRALLASVASRPPRVPLTMRSLHPKLVALAVQHHRGGWQALPNITDGRETYELVLTITQTRGRWLVSGVSNPR